MNETLSLHISNSHAIPPTKKNAYKKDLIDNEHRGTPTMFRNQRYKKKKY